jgi:hypothetical protein
VSSSPKKNFALRLDPALYAAIERLAAGELRSVNAQMEFLLREALVKRGVRMNGDDGAAPTPKDREA